MIAIVPGLFVFVVLILFTHTQTHTHRNAREFVLRITPECLWPNNTRKKCWQKRTKKNSYRENPNGFIIYGKFPEILRSIQWKLHVCRISKRTNNPVTVKDTLYPCPGTTIIANFSDIRDKSPDK